MFAIPLMDVAVQEVAALGLDPEKFRAFHEEALPRIYGYFLHRCGGSVPVAEDLTQETFLASVDELKKGRRPETPIPWIYGIARHKLLDHYRKQARSEQPLADAVLALEESAFPVQDDGGRERAVAALAAVPPRRGRCSCSATSTASPRRTDRDARGLRDEHRPIGTSDAATVDLRGAIRGELTILSLSPSCASSSPLRR